MPLTYQQALDAIHSFDDPYLAALRDHGRQTWGLAAIDTLLGRLGNPHLAYPTLHVAGTKGKGSTAAFIAQALIESGLKTGLYISPHLQDWRERIQIDRCLIPGEALARLVQDARGFTEQVPNLSAFEVTTALALWHFARERCDVAVVEVGLGGRLDATSVVRPLVSVITSISMDHMQLLGDTLAQIAAEKAAIIKPGTPVVSSPQKPEAQAVVEQRAEEMGSPLIMVGRDWLAQPVSLSLAGSEALIGTPGRLETYQIGLPGAFQIENAAVALAALEQVREAGLAVTDEGCRAGLAKTRWPGRLEKVRDDPLVVLDSAHNTYSMEKLVEALKTLAGGCPLTFVFGCMTDKDVEGMLSAMLPVARRVIFTQAEPARAAGAQDLLSMAVRIVAEDWQGEGDRPDLLAISTIAESVAYALEHTPSHEVICIAGSLAVVGEARTMLQRSAEC